MQDQVITLDASKFQDSLFIAISLKAMGFSRKVRDPDKLLAYFKQRQDEIEAKKAAGEAIDNSKLAVPVSELNSSMAKLEKGKGGITVTKTTLQSPALDRLKEHLNATKAGITAPPQYGGIANPSGIMEGLFELRKDLAELVNTKIAEGRRRLTETWIDDKDAMQPGFLTAFLEDFPRAIERARDLPILEGGLGPLWDAGDYPTLEQVAAGFDISRRWLAIGVPEGLPEALRQQALDELRTDLLAAGDTIKDALRNGLLELLAHGKEVLTTQPGDKPKVIKESLIGNVLQFCEVFSMRNTQGDSQLEAIVNDCKSALVGVRPEDCRKFAQVREETAAKFAELSAKVNGMIEEQKGRKFDLD